MIAGLRKFFSCVWKFHVEELPRAGEGLVDVHASDWSFECFDEIDVLASFLFCFFDVERVAGCVAHRVMEDEYFRSAGSGLGSEE